jgi:hypothetical protein
LTLNLRWFHLRTPIEPERKKETSPIVGRAATERPRDPAMKFFRNRKGRKTSTALLGLQCFGEAGVGGPYLRPASQANMDSGHQQTHPTQGNGEAQSALISPRAAPTSGCASARDREGTHDAASVCAGQPDPRATTVVRQNRLAAATSAHGHAVAAYHTAHRHPCSPQQTECDAFGSVVQRKSKSAKC